MEKNCLCPSLASSQTKTSQNEKRKSLQTVGFILICFDKCKEIVKNVCTFAATAALVAISKIKNESKFAEEIIFFCLFINFFTRLSRKKAENFHNPWDFLKRLASFLSCFQQMHSCPSD
jgi:phosphate starvation-inducible membrane PsiE